jgi:hypothetical protein
MDSPTRNASAFGASPQGAPSADRQSRITVALGFRSLQAATAVRSTTEH